MEILNYKEIPPGGNMLATFSVYIEPWKLKIHNCKVFRKKDGGFFFRAPQYCEEVNGQKKWYPIIEFSKERGEEFVKKVMEELKRFVK